MTRPDAARLTESEFHHAGPYRWLAGALDAHRDALDGAVRRLESDDSDDEAIHDLRVSTRRIRGLLDAGRDFLPGKAVKRLERRLRKARQALGPARDAEVGAALLGKLKPALPHDARAAAGALAAQLLVRRDRAAADGDIGALKLSRLPARLTRLVRDLEDRGWPDDDQPMTLAAFRRRALDRLHERWEAVRALPLEPILDHDAAAQHEFRIAGKKLRYTLELFAPLFPRPIERRIALLKAMQDQLGHLHDLAEVADEAHRLAGAARDAGFAVEAEGFAALAALLDDERRRGLDGFLPRHHALTHAGFLPPDVPAAPAAPAAESGAEPVPAPAADTGAADDAEAGHHAAPPLRLVDGRREESA